MAYQHGVYVQEVASRVVATASVDAGLPVVIGTAIKPFSDPKLVVTYDDAVKACGGYIGVNANGVHDFTLCEFVKAFFVNANLSKAVLINIFDPTKHISSSASSATVALSEGVGVLNVSNAVIQSVKVGTTDAVKGTDYTETYLEDGTRKLERVEGSTVVLASSSLTVSYKTADLSLVDAGDIEAGINKVADVYPQTLLVPGQLVCPKYSCFASIKTKLKNAAASVGGVYRCVALCDIATANDSLPSGGAAAAESVTGVTEYANVAAAKQVVSPDVALCWPMAKLGAELYHGSTILAATACQTDAANAGIPYASPSNHSANVSGAALKSGASVWLKAPQANELNAAGVVTLLSTSSGFVVWGNRLSAYPANTDAKDSMIPVRRMMDYVGNTLINTFFQKVDAPLNKRQVEAIVDSANIWLNGLVGGGYLIAGKVEFRDEDNTSLSLSDGVANFRVTLCPPSPNRAVIFTLEYNALAYSALFE